MVKEVAVVLVDILEASGVTVVLEDGKVGHADDIF